MADYRLSRSKSVSAYVLPQIQAVSYNLFIGLIHWIEATKTSTPFKSWRFNNESTERKKTTITTNIFCVFYSLDKN